MVLATDSREPVLTILKRGSEFRKGQVTRKVTEARNNKATRRWLSRWK